MCYDDFKVLDNKVISEEQLDQLMECSEVVQFDLNGLGVNNKKWYSFYFENDEEIQVYI